MPERAYLRAITVRRMYGTRFDLHVEKLLPGINVIFGANGSGKTTIAHAIQTVLLKGYVQAQRAALDASLSIGNQELRFDIDGPRRHCTRNGVRFDWKTAPELIRPESYHLSLHELLGAETEDTEFAGAILREASGGFDIAAAQKALDFIAPSLNRGRLNRMLETAQKELRLVKRAQSKLFRDKDRCEKLEAQLTAAQEAETLASLLKMAIEWQEAYKAWERASEALEVYPEVIRKSANLTNIVEEAAELEGTIAHLSIRCNDKKSKIESLEEKLAGGPLPTGGLPDGVLDTAADRVNSLRQLNAHIQKLEEDLAGAEEAADTAWTDLGGVAEAPEHFTRGEVRQLRHLAESATELAGKRTALQALRRVLKTEGGIDSEAESERLRRALDAFAKWLVAKRIPVSMLVQSLLIIAMAGSAAIALILGLSGTPIALFGLVVTIAVAVAYFQMTLTGNGSTEESEVRRIYPELPDILDRSDALQVLEDLLNRRGDIAVARAQEQRWEATAGDRDNLEAELSQFEFERKRFEEETGLSAHTRDATGVYVLARLVSWRDRMDTIKTLSGRRDKVLKTFESTLSELNAVLSQYGQPEALDVHEASGRFESLRSQDVAWKRDHVQLKGARDQLKGAQDHLAREQGNFNRIFGNLELEAGDFEGLRQCALKQAEYQKAAEREIQERAILEDKLHTVQNASGFTEALLEIDDLQLEFDAASAKAGRRHELQEAISEINLEVAQAEKGNSLERAFAAYQQAQDELAQARDNAVARAVGEVLTHHLAERARQLQLPRVFHRAKENFLKVTRGRYALEVRADGNFGAFDNEREMGLELRQLSSATRVQLLLCVRMAFVQEQELEYCLPVTLDETLGNSDDERARVIIRTISDLADERQVFYFTAQQDEVAKWEELCGADNINIVALSELRPRSPVDPDTLPQRLVLRDPTGHSHADFGRELSVPRWTGRDPLNGIHLWYLLEDPVQLHALLRQGVSTWGAANALYSNDLLELPVAIWNQLGLLVRALKSWQLGWQAGRGKPVDRAVLVASRAVGDRYIDDVLALCGDSGADGSDLLHALRKNRIRGFGPSRMAELEAYLHDHGYVAQSQKRSDSTIRSDVLAEIAGDMADLGLDHSAVDRMLTRIATGP